MKKRKKSHVCVSREPISRIFEKKSCTSFRSRVVSTSFFTSLYIYVHLYSIVAIWFVTLVECVFSLFTQITRSPHLSWKCAESVRAWERGTGLASLAINRSRRWYWRPSSSTTTVLYYHPLLLHSITIDRMIKPSSSELISRSYCSNQIDSSSSIASSPSRKQQQHHDNIKKEKHASKRIGRSPPFRCYCLPMAAELCE